MNTFRTFLAGVVFFAAFAVAQGDVIYNIQVNPTTVAAMQWNQDVTITFNYKASTAGGIRIFARPMSGNALTPAYAASGSPLYPVGTGAGTQSFTITSGSAVVDKIRFQVYNDSQSQLLLQFYVPVKFTYGSHQISNITITPNGDASLQHNQNVNITFNYRTTQTGGVRIFARPMSGTSLTPAYAASGSPLYPIGNGAGTGSFTITSGSSTVDGVRFQMYNDAQTQLLTEFVVPVKFAYSAHAISNIVVATGLTQGLRHNENVNMTFNYRTTEASGVRIFARPYTNGSATPGYGAHGSGVYATGSGAGSGWFTITAGDVTVDAIRFTMYNANQSQLLLEWFVPVSLHFSTSKITDVAFSPTSPAYFTNGERDNIAFDYTNSQAASVRIFVLPYLGSTLNTNYGVSPSPLYATGTGSATGFVTIMNGSAFIDNIQFKMTNDAQTATYVDWRIPVKFYFGNQVLTAVQPTSPEVPSEFVLAQNYPNPFNPTTTIAFKTQDAGFTTLRVYDILGKEVATLVHENLAAGTYSVGFDAKHFASGTYIYRLQSGSNVSTKKMMLTK